MKMHHYTEDYLRTRSDYYVVPRVSEFANDLDYAYGVVGTEEEAQAVATYFDGLVVDADWLMDKQERMHLAEGCSCGQHDSHGYKSADEFVDHIRVTFFEDEDEDEE